MSTTQDTPHSPSSAQASVLMLRYMRLGDVNDVAYIDRLSFDLPWTPRSYAYEVTESTYSHMVVLESSPVARGLRRLLHSLSSPPGGESLILGYGGLWHIADEAHISTIATHPEQRGQGYGELLLAAMIRRAITLSSSYIVLEVRVSNIVAQNLYFKYGFTIVDTKSRYYHNNGEDAYDMRLPLAGNAAYIAQFSRDYAALLRRTGVLDHFSSTLPPRGQA
jgi:ribosomal-protein-alanine N-acetyltransferase